MEQGKVALKSRPGKSTAQKLEYPPSARNQQGSNGITADGFNLILDNSLVKYAKDPFFADHAKNIDEKFKQKATNL